MIKCVEKKSVYIFFHFVKIKKKSNGHETRQYQDEIKGTLENLWCHKNV